MRITTMPVVLGSVPIRAACDANGYFIIHAIGVECTASIVVSCLPPLTPSDLARMYEWVDVYKIQPRSRRDAHRVRTKQNAQSWKKPQRIAAIELHRQNCPAMGRRGCTYKLPSRRKLGCNRSSTIKDGLTITFKSPWSAAQSQHRRNGNSIKNGFRDGIQRSIPS